MKKYIRMSPSTRFLRTWSHHQSRNNNTNSQHLAKPSILIIFSHHRFIMYSIKTISSVSLLAALISFTAASPLEAPPLAARDHSAHTNMYSSDICQGDVDSFDVVGSGGYRCVAVSNKRSISASGRYVHFKFRPSPLPSRKKKRKPVDGANYAGC